jgi:hypothetical protein
MVDIRSAVLLWEQMMLDDRRRELWKHCVGICPVADEAGIERYKDVRRVTRKKFRLLDASTMRGVNLRVLKRC